MFWNILYEKLNTLPFAAASAGAVIGHAVGSDQLYQLMRSEHYAGVISGIPAATDVISALNPIAGGVLAYCLARSTGNIFNSHKASYLALRQYLSSSEFFTYTLPEWPGHSGNGIRLVIGETHSDDPSDTTFSDSPVWHTINERGLYTGIIAYGGVGAGKTATFMYPCIEQMFEYKSSDIEKRVGGLVLDVKGDFVAYVEKQAIKHGREASLLKIRPGNGVKWNPIHEPNMDVKVLTYRLQGIYENMNSFDEGANAWVTDEMLKLLECAIGIIRVSEGYVTIKAVHEFILKISRPAAEEDERDIRDGLPQDPRARLDMIRHKYQKHCKTEELRSELGEGVTPAASKAWIDEMSQREFDGYYDYFADEYLGKSERERDIAKSALTKITQQFMSPVMQDTYSPAEEDITFKGFDAVIEDGDIVALDLGSTNGPIAGVLGIALKLAFEKAALARVERAKRDPSVNTDRVLMLVCDEYQRFASAAGKRCPEGDDEFFAQSRQSKCFPLLATQQPSSLINSVGEKAAVNIMNNIRTRVVLSISAEDDAEDISRGLGKHEVKKKSESVNENFDGGFNPLTSKVEGGSSGMGKSASYSTERDVQVYPEQIRALRMGEAIISVFDGSELRPPRKVFLKTHFMPDFFEDIYDSPREIPWKELYEWHSLVGKDKFDAQAEYKSFNKIRWAL